MGPKPLSNVQFWQELQEDGYFEHHPFYLGFKVAGGEEDLLAVTRFLPLRLDMKMVVIGCGYGRESLEFAPRVRHIWGIDVSRQILDKAVGFLASHNIHNFSAVLCSDYKERIPQDIDIVFSFVVMQHLTRDLVLDYFQTLRAKLKPGGYFVVQFLEELFEGVESMDAPLAKLEPSVSWTSRQIASLLEKAGLDFREIVTIKVTKTALWHWVFACRDSSS